MIVYLIFHYDYSSSEPVGLFLKEEDAVRECAELNRTDYYKTSYVVQKWEVDRLYGNIGELS